MAFIATFRANLNCNLAKPVTNSLFYIPQMQFTNKFRVTLRDWKKFGSLEHEINADMQIDEKPSYGFKSRRCGAIGYKIGMTHIYDKWGQHVP